MNAEPEQRRLGTADVRAFSSVTADDGASPLDSTPSPRPRIDEAAQRAHEAVDRLAASAGPAIERLRAGAHEATDQLSMQAQRMAQWPGQWADSSRGRVRDNPLAAIALAFAAGAALAQLISRRDPRA